MAGDLAFCRRPGEYDPVATLQAKERSPFVIRFSTYLSIFTSVVLFKKTYWESCGPGGSGAIIFPNVTDEECRGGVCGRLRIR